MSISQCPVIWIEAFSTKDILLSPARFLSAIFSNNNSRVIVMGFSIPAKLWSPWFDWNQIPSLISERLARPCKLVKEWFRVRAKPPIIDVKFFRSTKLLSFWFSENPKSPTVSRLFKPFKVVMEVFVIDKLPLIDSIESNGLRSVIWELSSFPSKVRFPSIWIYSFSPKDSNSSWVLMITSPKWIISSVFPSLLQPIRNKNKSPLKIESDFIKSMSFH